RGHANVARRADVEIELVVGPYGQEFPAVRSIARQVVVDDRRLRRVVELIGDPVDLRNLVDLGDVKRAVVEGEAVRRVETAGDRLDLFLAVLVGDGVDLVDVAGADIHVAPVIDPQRAGIGDPGGIDLDVEAFGQGQPGHRQLVDGGGDRQRRH